MCHLHEVMHGFKQLLVWVDHVPKMHHQLDHY